MSRRTFFGDILGLLQESPQFNSGELCKTRTLVASIKSSMGMQEVKWPNEIPRRILIALAFLHKPEPPQSSKSGFRKLVLKGTINHLYMGYFNSVSHTIGIQIIDGAISCSWVVSQGESVSNQNQYSENPCMVCSFIILFWNKLKKSTTFYLETRREICNKTELQKNQTENFVLEIWNE